MMRVNKRGDGAFTLIEVLVASVMLAFVMASVAAIVAGTLLGARRVEAAIAADLEVAEAEDLIAEDLAFLAVAPGADPLSVTEGSGGGAVLTFRSAAGARAAWGDVITPVHTVTYRIRAMSDGGMGLFRSETPLVKSKGVFYDDSLLVIGGVERFMVAAFDGLEWHSKWPAGDGESAMPILLQVEATFADGAAARRSIFVEAALEAAHESPAGGEDAEGADESEKEAEGEGAAGGEPESGGAE